MKYAIVILVLFSNSIWCQITKTHDVFFETDKYAITNIEQHKLKTFISTIDTTAIEQVTIYGYCDDRGSIAYNLNLSQNRAKAIKQYFKNQSIKGGLITNTSGEGEIALVDSTDIAIDFERSKNRKVTVTVLERDTDTPKPSPSSASSTTKTTEDIILGNIKKGDKILLKDLYFRKGYSFLVPESKKNLEAIAKILKQHDNIYFTIQGHVCCTKNDRDAIDRATKKRNLSEARAKYVYNFLLKYGINKRRMRHQGMGRKHPLGGDSKHDRRVEFLITYVANR